MVDIATTLAADFIGAQGWSCIHIAPQGETCIVTIGGINARNELGHRIWLSRKHADRVIAALFSRHQEATRRPRGEGLLVKLGIEVCDAKVRTIADSLGYAVTDDAFVDGQLALVFNRIEAAMVRMQKDGSMKALNREYRTAREKAATSGSTFPAKYDHWLVARLRPAMQGGL